MKLEHHRGSRNVLVSLGVLKCHPHCPPPPHLFLISAPSGNPRPGPSCLGGATLPEVSGAGRFSDGIGAKANSLALTGPPS